MLPSERQVWKVTSRAGSDATPSVAGLSAGQMAALLADRIRRSGGHLVFIDELDGDFTGADGAALAGALATLAGQPDPYSAEPGGWPAGCTSTCRAWARCWPPRAPGPRRGAR